MRRQKFLATLSRHFRAKIGQKRRTLQKSSICRHPVQYAQHLSDSVFFRFLKIFETSRLSGLLNMCAWCPQVPVIVLEGSPGVT